MQGPFVKILRGKRIGGIGGMNITTIGVVTLPIPFAQFGVVLEKEFGGPR